MSPGGKKLVPGRCCQAGSQPRSPVVPVLGDPPKLSGSVFDLSSELEGLLITIVLIIISGSWSILWDGCTDPDCQESMG